MESADAAAVAVTEAMLVYWCHECDMSVTLLSAAAASCPDCHGTFLERIDSESPPLGPHHDDNDTFLLDSPAFRRLILSRLSDLDLPRRRISPLPTVQISSAHLDLDPVLLCAICKEQFLLAAEAKQLPCNHLYHSDCILPWLSNHNSCPLCRFALPSEDPDDRDWVSFEAALSGGSRSHCPLFPATETDDRDH